MTTEEKINKLQAQIDELRKEVKPKFEVGKWYKFKSGIVNYQNGEYGYGVWYDKWCDKIYFYGQEKAERPATDKEVEEALIKEAERRYSKAKGYITSGRSWIVNEFHRYKYIEGALRLYADVTCVGSGNRFETGFNEVFRDGKWAEIIKDEPIKVGGVDCVVDSCGAWFDKNQYSWEEINSLVRIFKNHSSQLKSINVGCSGQYNVDLELLEKILALKK